MGVLETARYAFNNGVYSDNGGKRQGERLLQTSGTCGLFIDEIVPINGATFWFYHGNPIAMKDSDGTVYRSSCGWETKTTKERLNETGANIAQRKGKWFDNGEPFKDDSKVIQDKLGMELYHAIDGWRGYQIPAFAVASASNTGGWSDSPYRPEEVQRELRKICEVLRKEGIRYYKAASVTSNIFCVKEHIIVRGYDYERAVSSLNESRVFDNTHIAYPSRG